jgi:RNA polymerase sigma factor (sigma-70 family)
LVAVPSIGRATEVTPRRAAPEADATRDLYERYARQIYSYCLHQLGNREEAEDAAQSTFLNAFRGFKRGVDPEFESAWLYKIAQNVCLTRQRSSSRRRKVETPGDLEAMQDYVPAHQVDSDELIRLPEALDAMPEQQRRALLLREWQGLSYKEIGEELDLSQAAVETLLFRARRSLAAGLSEEQPPLKKAAGMAKRLGAGDLGSILSVVKSLVLTGGVKVATAVATVAATSVVAATPLTRHAVEEIVTPRPDKTPVHQVSAKAAAGTRAARVGAPFSLVPTHAAAATAAGNAPLTKAAAKVRRHRSALRAANSTAGKGLMVGHAPSTTEPSATIATAPVPTVDTSAPTPAPAADPTPPPATPASQQPAATQPAADKPQSDSGGNGNASTPSATTPKKDETPTVSQITPAATPAAPAARANDRNLASSDNGKKNDDKKHGKAGTPPAVTPTTPAVAQTTPTTTTSTTTTTATPTVTPPTTTTTTSTTATTAAPTPAPPTVTTPAVPPTQSSRPAEGHKPDGRGDNGNGNNGNGKKK